jgi:hypothetical protein
VGHKDGTTHRRSEVDVVVIGQIPGENGHGIRGRMERRDQERGKSEGATLGEAGDDETVRPESCLVEDFADAVGEGVEASAEGALVETVLVDGVPDGSVVRLESGLGNHHEPAPFGIELVDPVEEVPGGIAVTGEQEQNPLGSMGITTDGVQHG